MLGCVTSFGVVPAWNGDGYLCGGGGFETMAFSVLTLKS